MHDGGGQAERGEEPGHGHIAVLRDVTGLEGHLDLQDLGMLGQHVPGGVDLQEIRFAILRLLTT